MKNYNYKILLKKGRVIILGRRSVKKLIWGGGRGLLVE